MKKTQQVLTTIISLIILTFFVSNVQAQVCTGDYVIDGIDTSGDIAVLSGCTEITGDLTIRNTALTNLTGLENLTSVGGIVLIEYNDSLTSLRGLDSLTSVNENLWIQLNNVLTSLSGLENLTSVGGSLAIAWNDTLTSLNGLENLTATGGALFIEHTNSLNDLSALSNLVSVGEALYIYDNLALTNLCPLYNIHLTGYTIHISDNTVLSMDTAYALETQLRSNGFTGDAQLYSNYGSGLATCNVCDGDYFIDDIDTSGDIAVLSDCTEITGILTITNTLLTSLSGLENLTRVGESLDINDNYILETLNGLENLVSVGGILSIAYNSSLTSLSALESLTSVDDSLGIGYNDSLVSLSGLENLTSVGGGLYITENYSLASLSGLENLTYVYESLDISYNYSLINLCALYNVLLGGTGLEIYDNNALSMATANALKEQLTINGFTGDFHIGDNNGSGIVCCGSETDNDNDLICSNTDNCPNIANPNQEDADSDGIGDVCDENTIYGTVSGDVQEGVTVNIYIFSCGAPQPHAAVTTNAQGYYAIGDLPNGQYWVVPEEAGYGFSSSYWVDIPQTEIQSYDFTAALITYGISGTVSGDLQEGITITLSGDSSATTTPGDGGSYSFTGLTKGNYTITPNRTGYWFYPENEGITIADVDITGVDFTAVETALSFNMPIAICSRSLVDYHCNIGRSFPDNDQVARWTDFTQEGTGGCGTASQSTAEDLVEICSDNSITLDSEKDLSTTNGSWSIVFQSIETCFFNGGDPGTPGPDTPRVLPVTLPVIDCKTSGNCRDMKAFVNVDIVWVKLTNDPRYDNAPFELYNADGSGYEWQSDPADFDNGTARWNDFADHFNLQDQYGDQAEYPGKMKIFFKPSCD